MKTFGNIMGWLWLVLPVAAVILIVRACRPASPPEQPREPRRVQWLDGQPVNVRAFIAPTNVTIGLADDHTVVWRVAP